MPTFRSFEEIEAWKLARTLVKQVYVASDKAIGARDFSLHDQMRRSAVSIMANIAEGFERSGTKEFIQFLSLSKGSAGELKSHFYVAYDLGYFDNALFLSLSDQASMVGSKIGALVQYLRRSAFRGSKFQLPHQATQTNSKHVTRNA
jgi:four helix bundle protein